MSTETRKYDQRARAESQRATRERIVRVAAELHEEIGVARTTVAEIARRAGVSRLTVYNHFPDLAHLLPACSAHYLAQHPQPSLEAAFAHEDPRERVREALTALYRWYRETEPMSLKISADRASVPELDEFCKHTIDVARGELASTLAGGFAARGRRAERLRASVAVAVDFWTWRRLDRQGLDDGEAAEVMAAAIAAQ